MYHPKKRPPLFPILLLSTIAIIALGTTAILLKDWNIAFDTGVIFIAALGILRAHSSFTLRLSLLFFLSFLSFTHAISTGLTQLDIFPLASYPIIQFITFQHACTTLFAVAATWLGWQCQLGLIHHRYQRRLNSSLGPLTIASLFALGACYIMNLPSPFLNFSNPPIELSILGSQLTGVFIGSILVRFHVLR